MRRSSAGSLRMRRADSSGSPVIRETSRRPTSPRTKTLQAAASPRVSRRALQQKLGRWLASVLRSNKQDMNTAWVDCHARKPRHESGPSGRSDTWTRDFAGPPARTKGNRTILTVLSRHAHLLRTASEGQLSGVLPRKDSRRRLTRDERPVYWQRAA
jgi:hypothetical protein